MTDVKRLKELYLNSAPEILALIEAAINPFLLEDGQYATFHEQEEIAKAHENFKKALAPFQSISTESVSLSDSI